MVIFHSYVNLPEGNVWFSLRSLPSPFHPVVYRVSFSINMYEHCHLGDTTCQTHWNIMIYPIIYQYQTQCYTSLAYPIIYPIIPHRYTCWFYNVIHSISSQVPASRTMPVSPGSSRYGDQGRLLLVFNGYLMGISREYTDIHSKRVMGYMSYDQATWYTLIWYLVDGWPTPLKNDGVRHLGWLFHSQSMDKTSPTCSKPPTRYYRTDIPYIHYIYHPLSSINHPLTIH